MSANKVRVGVIGVGSLGKEHARIYSELARDQKVEFVGLTDSNSESAQKFSKKYNVTLFKTATDLCKAVDAVSLVTPTNTHYELGKYLLSRGKHVLIEKPITQKVSEAEELVRIAKEEGCLLQVGHVERFNPVFQYLKEVAKQPRFIEAHRLSPYSGRSTDIGVVLDLMIHDLDVVLAFVNSRIVAVDAVGIQVLSETEDIANARLKFENGCVANLTASRISPDQMRKIRVFSGGDQTSYVSLDYRAQEGFIYRLARSDEKESSLISKLIASKDSNIVSEFGGKRIVREPAPVEKDEPLKQELASFIHCASTHTSPVVSGESGSKALELAMAITHQIQLNAGVART